MKRINITPFRISAISTGRRNIQHLFHFVDGAGWPAFGRVGDLAVRFDKGADLAYFNLVDSVPTSRM